MSGCSFKNQMELNYTYTITRKSELTLYPVPCSKLLLFPLSLHGHTERKMCTEIPEYKPFHPQNTQKQSPEADLKALSCLCPWVTPAAREPPVDPVAAGTRCCGTSTPREQDTQHTGGGDGWEDLSHQTQRAEKRKKERSRCKLRAVQETARTGEDRNTK